METMNQLVEVTEWRQDAILALPQEDAAADDPAWALAGDPDEDLVCRVTATTDVAPAGSVVVHSNGHARLFVPISREIESLAHKIERLAAKAERVRRKVAALADDGGSRDGLSAHIEACLADALFDVAEITAAWEDWMDEHADA
jgi:hypothetical protein